MKTREEVEKLKRDWLIDPCWDIEDTEEFEEYKEELLQFRKQCEAKWNYEIFKEWKKDKGEADKLGLVGLYRLIKEQEKMIDRYKRAIYVLIEGRDNNVQMQVYNILMGYDD